MKKFIAFISIALSAHFLNAQTAPATNSEPENRQTYFYCDFSNGIPSDFATYDRDGKTLHFSMTQAGLQKGESWVAVQEEFSSPLNYYAGSGSKHKYAADEEKAAADDWMITPQIWIKGNNAKLTWRGKSFGENKKTSSYNVYISTTGNTPDDFTAAPVLVVESESASQWTDYEVSLEQFYGQSIYISFVNNSFDKEILAIDDIKVEGEKGLCELLVTTDDYITGVDALTVSASLTAYSDEEINSFTAFYEHNGDVVSKQISGISLKKYDTHNFSFDQTIPAVIGDTIRYKVWAEVNGTTIEAIERTTIPFLFIPKRKVVVEEGTAMWCVYCPKGLVAMEELAKKYPDNFIGIAIHYDDVLEVKDYRSDLNFPGFPSAYINRKYISPDIMKEVLIDGRMQYSMLYGGIESLFLDALAEITIAEVSIKSDIIDGKINATVTSRFATDIDEADYQIAIVVIENDVTGPGFYQDNGFAGSSIPMGGYESMPDRIYNPVYQEIARDVFDNYMGIPGSVPTSITAGSDNVFEFSASIPENVGSIDKTEIIALLIDQNSGEIVNANITNAVSAGINDAIADKNLSLSYCIENETCLIDIASDSATPIVASLYSATGTLLHTATLEIDGGKASLPIEIGGKKGIHFVSVAQGNNTASLKIIF